MGFLSFVFASDMLWEGQWRDAGRAVLGLCLQCLCLPRLFYILYIEKQKESSFQILYCVRLKIYRLVHTPLSVVQMNKQGLLALAALNLFHFFCFK